MDAIPLELWTAFEAIAVGGLLILAGYIRDTARSSDGSTLQGIVLHHMR
jgi:hypothetical protein